MEPNNHAMRRIEEDLDAIVSQSHLPTQFIGCTETDHRLVRGPIPSPTRTDCSLEMIAMLHEYCFGPRASRKAILSSRGMVVPAMLGMRVPVHYP